MQRVKNTFFLLLGLAIIAWSFYTFWQRPAPAHYQQNLSTSQVDKLETGREIINIEIADTDTERTRGLSGREALADGSGMLFIFPELGLHGIWMKEMKFALDIIWLDESMQVIWIERRVTPATYPQVFAPQSPAKYVLEVSAGNAISLGIDIGSHMYFSTQK